MACLDNRRLNAQHNETLIALSVMRKFTETGKPTGWSRSPQLTPFWGKRGALYQYYNDMVLPACKERFHRSEKYAVRGPLSLGELPPGERDYGFWECVTWREVLRDCRHLFEKHQNDKAIVAISKDRRRKTRVVVPKGHNELALHLVMERAICHVFSLDTTDEAEAQKERLLQEQLLDPVLT